LLRGEAVGRLRVGIEDVASILQRKIRNVYRSCNESSLPAELVKSDPRFRGF
jgi:hypothetical protein